MQIMFYKFLWKIEKKISKYLIDKGYHDNLLTTLDPDFWELYNE